MVIIIRLTQKVESSNTRIASEILFLYKLILKVFQADSSAEPLIWNSYQRPGVSGRVTDRKAGLSKFSNGYQYKNLLLRNVNEINDNM